MSLQSLGHQFIVNSIPYQVDTGIRINIKKRKERIVYRTLSDGDNINISYLIGEETTPANNFFLSDRGTSLVQNRVVQGSITTETTKTFQVQVNNFLVTNVFTPELPSKAAEPLFYVHTLVGYNEDVDNFSTKTIIVLEFTDQDLKTINFTDYVLDSSTGEIFSNLENEFDGNTLTLYFVKYTIKDSSDGSIEVFHELINNKPIFAQATFDDIGPSGAITNPKRYTIESTPGGQSFLITLAQTDIYALKEIPASRIRVLPPTAIDTASPWYVRVTNGAFLTSLRNSATTFTTYRYELSEFDSQLFQPEPPIKFRLGEKAIWLSSFLFQAPRNIISSTSNGVYIDILVRDKKGDPKYAFTNDTLKIDSVWEGSITYENQILSVDESGGFIEVNKAIRDDDEVTLNYFTIESEYEFTAIDFNPVDNIDILRKRVVLYLYPESAYTGSLSKNLYYLIVDPLGKVVFSSQASEGATDTATTKMLDEDFYENGLPKHTFYYDKESTVSGLASRASGVNLDYIDDFSFIDKYTVESVLLNEPPLVSGTFYNLNLKENPHYLLLADMYVGSHQSPSNLATFDVRKRGGGIKESLLSDALDLQPEVSWYWDINQPRHYPSVGSFLMEYPQEILQENGGRFSVDSIRSVVERHMKIGGYVVLKSYNLNPVILDSGVVLNSGQFFFCWPSYYSDVRYDVELSPSINGLFSGINSSPIPDTASGNCYTVTDLIPSTKYFIRIAATRDGVVSRSPVVSFTTTAIIT